MVIVCKFVIVIYSPKSHADYRFSRRLDIFCIRYHQAHILVGIGGGSHCTTRLVTGVGRPQLSTITDCYKVTKRYDIPLISDAGIKYTGDVAKALVFGADCVMIGGMFAGTNEAPGEIVRKGDKKYKYSWGMCSDTALKHKQPQRRFSLKEIINFMKGLINYNTTEYKDKLFEEGLGGLVPYKGSVIPILEDLVNGTRRTMWYLGARNIPQLQKKARVVIVSNNSKFENLPRI